MFSNCLWIRASIDAAFCVMVLHFLPNPQSAIAGLCRITRPGGSVILVDLVQHKQEWMREQMAHQWLGFDRQAIEGWFRDAGAESIDYDLTGSFAGEKLARNGNRPVEIFVARAILPTMPKLKTKKGQAMTESEKQLRQILAERVAILDGAMGTMIQSHKLDEAGVSRRAICATIVAI